MTRNLRFLMITAALTALSLPALADDRQTSGHPGRSTDSDTSTQTTPPSDTTAPPSTQQAAPPPAAAPPANPSVTLKSLLDGGYEIKTVNIIPHDIVKAGGSTTDVDAVMIVVENGPQIADCYVTFSSFSDGSYYNGSVPVCTVLQ